MNASEMPSKGEILALLYTWVHQRPGLEYGNYCTPGGGEGRKAYFSEMRGITRQLHDARILLRSVELSGIDAPELMAAFSSAYSGRLSLTPGKKPGTWALDYCTGQYWPTEYRRAACAVLSQALWNWKANRCMPKGELRHNQETGETLTRYKGMRAGDYIRGSFRREYGRAFQQRHFD